MTTTTTTAIADAFAADPDASRRADELAARIAADRCGAKDTPGTIRKTFEAAGLDQTGAEAEVERHRKVAEWRQRLRQAEKAAATREKLDAEIAQVERQRAEALVEHDRRLRELGQRCEGVRSAAIVAQQARKELAALLPPHVRTELDVIAEEFIRLHKDERRLNDELRRHSPVEVDELRLACLQTRKQREEEREQVERANRARSTKRAELSAELDQVKTRQRELNAKAEKLRGIYLP